MDNRITIGKPKVIEIFRCADRLGFYTHLIIPIEINGESQEAANKLGAVIENLLTEINKVKERLDEIQKS